VIPPDLLYRLPDMTDNQWRELLDVIDGRRLDRLPVGLIIDGCWLADWTGISVLDYFSDPRLWLEANFKAVRRFPEVMFLPGFWAEYGMCTEPSAFGTRCVWLEDAFPFAKKMLHDYADVNELTKPDCRTDGMCPFVVKRLQLCRSAIEEGGHRIRFATARGPMNIATYLLGHTETLIGVKTNPAEVHKLLDIVTEFVVGGLRGICSAVLQADLRFAGRAGEGPAQRLLRDDYGAVPLGDGL